MTFKLGRYAASLDFRDWIFMRFADNGLDASSIVFSLRWPPVKLTEIKFEVSEPWVSEP